jgi:glycosyltransferase involved in cell wall biosynthesis
MTGYTLPLGATYKEFADKIYTLANDSDSLEKMKQNARQKYENDLNWKVFGKKLNKVIEQLI